MEDVCYHHCCFSFLPYCGANVFIFSSETSKDLSQATSFSVVSKGINYFFQLFHIFFFTTGKLISAPLALVSSS